MEKIGEIVWGGVKASPGVMATLWLRLVNHDAAWWVSMLTMAYIVSQLIWGWSKFFGKKTS
ncbi:hypothetical protein F3J17_26790 [Burkholderia sp. Ax-1719]|nr:hypothetical protein [Burkholderia sp. Ax-1719]